MPEVVEGLESRGAFAAVRQADGDATREVAETVVVYRRAGRVREGTRRGWVPGDRLAVRLVGGRGHGSDGAVVARLRVRPRGRQMKRSHPVTDSAVAAGREKVLAGLDILVDV